MTKIGIVTFQDGYNRGACDFYPLIKWKKDFEKKNIEIFFSKSHSNEALLKADIIGIDSRYYRELTVNQDRYESLDFIIDAVSCFRSKGIKVVLFDNDDSSGGRQWDLIEHVDILVKKQVLKNREFYTLDNGVLNYKPFIKSYGVEISMDRNSKYKPCPPDQLYKIKLGWNIGMKDYRYFPLSEFYPFGTSRLLNRIYNIPNFAEPSANRPIDSSFRGEIRKGNKVYSFQRNKVIELLSNKNNARFKTGNIISKWKYYRELENSKVTVSPYGWGEVCYRDFEATINGSLLIKPNMNHLETYPNIYKENQTYIPIRWDMNDLNEVLDLTLKYYNDHIPIIKKARKLYKNALKDSQLFVNHFVNSLEI